MACEANGCDVPFDGCTHFRCVYRVVIHGLEGVGEVTDKEKIEEAADIYEIESSSLHTRNNCYFDIENAFKAGVAWRDAQPKPLEDMYNLRVNALVKALEDSICDLNLAENGIGRHLIVQPVLEARSRLCKALAEWRGEK